MKVTLKLRQKKEMEEKALNLFISDLDGTLLDSGAAVSLRSRRILNRLLDAGVLFTVASARTPLSAVSILEDLHLQLPVILMNGAMIYDVAGNRILEAEGFSEQEIRKLAGAETAAGVTGALITESEGRLELNLGDDGNGLSRECFRIDEVKKNPSVKGVRFGRPAADLGKERVLYGLYADRKPDRLKKMAEFLSADSALTLDFYRDRYDDRRWCLEITSGHISKKQGALYLKRQYPQARLVGFGDGINDIPLCEACEEFHAVAGACAGLLEKADGVIGSCREDGVAVYLEKWWEKHEKDFTGEPLPAEHGGKGQTI